MPEYDAVVCGSCVLDILCRPVTLDRAIGEGQLIRTQPPVALPGGITANAGIAMRRLGLDVAIASRVGEDAWGVQWRQTLETEGVDTAPMEVADDAPTSTTVVLIDDAGQRSFLHAQGAPKRINAGFFEAREALWGSATWMLLGYYPLLPDLIDDLPLVLAQLRGVGCKTAMDSAGDGGAIEPLIPVLPHLDLYVPSLAEAERQTGLRDPERMIETYRRYGAPGVLGIKLGGADGVLLSEEAGVYLHIPSDTPPGPVVDTTGAGDCFLAGLIAGLVRGLSLEGAGRLGCATAAQSVIAMGGWPGVKR